MSESIAAELRIGGKIPVSLLPGLCQAIQHEVVALDWGDGRFSPTTAEDLLEARQVCDGVPLLCLFDDHARWGEFEELEAFLRRHGVAYDRFSDPKYEYMAETAHFRPRQKLAVLATDPARQPVLPASRLAEVETVLARAIDRLTAGNAASGLRAVRQAWRHLRKQLPPNVASLEPFEVIHLPPNEDLPHG